MSQGILVIISSIVGGLIGFISSFSITLLSQKQQLRMQREAQEHELVRERQAIVLFPLRQKALETVWSSLFQLSNGPLSDSEWQEFMRATLWLPEEIKTPCVSIVSRPGDSKMIESVRALVNAYVHTLEFPKRDEVVAVR